jgi:hypothetical protein
MHSIRAATESDVSAITQNLNAHIETTTYEWTETQHIGESRRVWVAQKKAAGEPVLVASEGEVVVGVASYGDFRDSRRCPATGSPSSTQFMWLSHSGVEASVGHCFPHWQPTPASKASG